MRKTNTPYPVLSWPWLIWVMPWWVGCFYCWLILAGCCDFLDFLDFLDFFGFFSICFVFLEHVLPEFTKMGHGYMAIQFARAGTPHLDRRDLGDTTCVTQAMVRNKCYDTADKSLYSSILLL